MKNLSIFLIAELLVCGCGRNELSREEALALIKKEKGYPHVYGHEIFCGDPDHVTKLYSEDLDQKGWVIIHKTLKLGEIGSKPIIEFT
ncbi:hypothetical protein [Mucilaginibacter polytrichastri]|uniref:hypothetical protein n=1 Tax=Mucilaginibacter polytrichastri TaxID=1302689 RepID=UPI0008F2C151|nr:hypothetical protein [Mucilaginibacter polytrichastri]SFS61978.1 hypothetical protein SAMN04487890_102433 [Mucilaginibacter polytrichastri]